MSTLPQPKAIAQREKAEAAKKAEAAAKKAAKAAAVENGEGNTENTFSDALYQELNRNGDFTRQDVALMLKAFSSTLLSQLETKGRVLINNVGRFATSERAARKGVNPRTQAPVDIPASLGVTYKPSKSVKDYLNGGNVAE